MSLKFADIVAIRDSEGLTMTEKMCLTMIYSRGDEHTASIKTLTKNMGLKSDRYVRNIVNSLKDRGLLTVVEHSGDTSEITINTRALQALVPEKVTHAPQSTPAPQSKGGMRPRAGEGCSPEPTKENTKENLKEKEQASAGASALSSETTKAKTKDMTKKMTASLIAEKRTEAVVKSGQQEATPAPQSMGTSDGTIDYRAEARKDRDVAYYFDKYKFTGPEGSEISDKKAYRMAMKMAGKEVKL